MAASHTALSHEQLLSALERRFDYLSARSVAGELLALAGVAKADAYDAAATAKLRAAAETSLTRAHAVLEAFGTAAPAAPVAAAPAKPAAAPEAPAPVAEAAPEAAPADDAAADKADKKKKA